MTKKGIDFVIMLGTNKIAGQRGASLSRSADTMEATSKDSNGWKEFESSFKEWSIDADGLLPVNDAGYTALEDAFTSGSKLDVKLVDTDGKGFEGQVIVSDFPIEAPYDDLATYSVTFQGTGELEKLSA